MRHLAVSRLRESTARPQRRIRESQFVRWYNSSAGKTLAVGEPSTLEVNEYFWKRPTCEFHFFPKIFFSRSGPNSLTSSSLMRNGTDITTRENVAPTPRLASR